VDNQVASTTLVLATAIADLDAGEYIKSANNEYMRVSALSIDKKTDGHACSQSARACRRADCRSCGWVFDYLGGGRG